MRPPTARYRTAPARTALQTSGHEAAETMSPDAPQSSSASARVYAKGYNRALLHVPSQGSAQADADAMIIAGELWKGRSGIRTSAGVAPCTHPVSAQPTSLRLWRDSDCFSSSQGMSLNRSQFGGCSTKYNTRAGN
jgi:hypothetical protein